MATPNKRTKAAAPAQPEAADQQADRITPALWMPAAPTIAWLAFSSAETDWDAKFYFGASIWYAAAQDPSQASVRSYMKEWADKKMGMDPPSDSSIERRIDLLVVKNIYVR